MKTIPVEEAPNVHSYSRGVDIFVLAAHSFGFDPSSDQVGEWTDLLAAARVLDDLLDSEEPKSDREDEYDTHVDAMFNNPSSSLITNPELFSSIRGHSELWSRVKVNRVISLTENVKDIASTGRELESANQLGLLSLREGTETARLFEIDAPILPCEQDFNAWLEVLLRFGIVVDKALDLPEDYKNGLTKVLPTRLNQASIAVCGREDLRGTLAKTPLKLYWTLAKAAMAVADDTKKDTILRTN